MPFFNTVEPCRGASREYAIEGSTFVLLASHTQSEAGLRANGLLSDDLAGQDLPHVCAVGGGFTEIFAPDGRTLSDPVDPSWEGLVYGELDFNEIYLAKNIVDPVGQYSRPDIFSLRVDKTVKRPCVYAGDEKVFSHAQRFPYLEEDESIVA